MSKRRRAETSGQATSPKLGPKTRTRVHALQQPARRRTAPLVARFEAAAEDPAVIASQLLGPSHSSQVGLCSCLIRVLQPLVSRAWQAIGEEMDTSTLCVKSIVESWRNKVADPWRVGECC